MESNAGKVRKDAKKEYMDEVFRKLGRRYRKIRLQRHMVQEDVLDHNFAVRHYQQLEAGRHHSLDTFFRLSKMFHVNPEVLIRGVFDRNHTHPGSGRLHGFSASGALSVALTFFPK